MFFQRKILPPIIKHFVFMGDSLSDRSTLDHKKLLDIIPMATLSGLAGKSPQGRFTNGFVWTDNVCVELINEFLIAQAEKKAHFSHDDAALHHKSRGKRWHDLDEKVEEKVEENADLSDALISDPRMTQSAEGSYDLDDDRQVTYKGRDFVRSYAEGGLTAHSYHFWESIHTDKSGFSALIDMIRMFFSRFILATLSQKRSELLAYDEKHAVSAQQKSQTLIVEWSGANDLITVNSLPTLDEAEKILNERIDNILKLYKNGYRHFVLNNLPDLSLTPRYATKSAEEKRHASVVVNYFNQQLKARCQQLQADHPDLTIGVFDAHAEFNEIYQHPEKYGFDGAKIHTPYTSSDQFKLNGAASPAPGYMFWDDVHPSAIMHWYLAQKFYDFCRQPYLIKAPEPESGKSLYAQFKRKYEQVLRKEGCKNLFSCFSQLKKLEIGPEETAESALPKILKAAIEDNHPHVRKAILDLGWIDEHNHINPKIPVLAHIAAPQDKALNQVAAP